MVGCVLAGTGAMLAASPEYSPEEIAVKIAESWTLIVASIIAEFAAIKTA